MIKKQIIFKVTDGDCFEVTSHALTGGYPKIHPPGGGSPMNISRFIWSECFGLIPKGMCVCHHCDNPLCINSEHLFLGTQADNMQDKKMKGRAPVCEAATVAKLTNQQVLSIRAECIPGSRSVGCTNLARLYGVSGTTIRKIVKRETWTTI